MNEEKQMNFPWWEETRKLKQKKTHSYQEFVDKFKPKKTTDDCYTPEKVYENLKTYVFKKYGLDPNTPVVRPFWPGADFTACNYPAGCIVIDNPPFSILGKIIKYYNDNRVRFFLFAPALTVMQHIDKDTGITFINAGIVYENGANVRTAFIHNLDNAITCSGVLDRLVRGAQNSVKKLSIKWPDNWLAASDFMNKTRRMCDNEEYCVILYSPLKKTGNVARFGSGVLVADAVADDFRGMRNDKDGIPVELKDCDKETVRMLNIQWEEQERKRRQPGG